MNGAGSKLPIMKSIRSPDNAVFLNPPASEEIAPQVSQISQAGFESNEFCYKAGRKTFGSNVLLSSFISHTLLCSLSCCHPPILFVIRKYCMSTSVIPTLLSLDGWIKHIFWYSSNAFSTARWFGIKMQDIVFDSVTLLSNAVDISNT